MTPLIITAAICGAEVSRRTAPSLPLSACELADEALACEKAGASIIHLHVRDEDGEPTQDLETFRRAVDAMNEKGVTALIQPSTGGAVGMTAEERLQPAALNPETASLDCGSLNFGDSYFINDYPLMRGFAAEMQRRGIFPELECFEGGHIFNALKLRDEGLLPDHLHFNIVLGVPGALPATAKNLLYMTELLPPGSSWSVSAVGRHQLPMNLIAMAMGGHTRIGLEDNIYMSKGVLAEGNAPFVTRLARFAAELGRSIASPDDVRNLFCINRRKNEKD